MKTRIGDISMQIRGVSYKPSDISDGQAPHSIAILRANNISNDGNIETSDLVWIREERIKSEQFLRDGDILLCASSGSKGLVGKAAQVNGVCGMSFGAFCKVIRPTIANKKYLGFYFQSPQYRHSISEASAGININNIRAEDLDHLEIELPDEVEQGRRCFILDKAVKAIRLRKQQIEKLNDLVKSQFIEMFGDLRKNPKGWNFMPLGKVCDVRDGTHDSPKYCSEGYPLLTSKNFTDGGVDFKGANFISEKDYFAINQRSKVDVGDIVMPMIGTIGHPVIIDTQKPFAIKNVALIKFAKSKFLNVFIRAILDSDYFSAIITSKNRGNTQKFIALGDIRAIEIPQVPYEIQKQFARFIEQTDKSKIPYEMEVAA